MSDLKSVREFVTDRSRDMLFTKRALELDEDLVDMIELYNQSVRADNAFAIQTTQSLITRSHARLERHFNRHLFIVR